MNIRIDINRQILTVFERQKQVFSYLISSATNGVGQQFGSECTPLGKHIIRAKIGAHLPENTVFVGRRPTGEIYTPQLRINNPNRDWILTRILWLSGLERGENRLGKVDTMRRYIYIHGTPDDVILGKAGSRGCIRMRNKDLVTLFNMASVGTPVNIIN